MNRLISFSFLFIIILGVFLSCFGLDYYTFGIDENTIYTSESGFTWPIPNFYKVSSYFGYRDSVSVSPSSYHRGIDIPASENTYFLASISGKITFTGFRGSGRLYYNIRK